MIPFKKKKTGVPMQISALACDIIATNKEMHRFFYQISTFPHMTKNQCSNKCLKIFSVTTNTLSSFSLP